MKQFYLLALTSSLLSACGVGTSQLPEAWDLARDPLATYDMEVQVKQAIYCELKRAAKDVVDFQALHGPEERVGNDGKNIANEEDSLLPNSWGVLMQLSLQAEEKSSLTPGITFKTPVHNAPVNFPGETIGATGVAAATTYGPLSVPQSYALGVGGQLSSDNTRYDKFFTYYSAKQLKHFPPTPNTGTGPCRSNYFQNDPQSSSSPFLDASSLGLREWLVSAVRVIAFERSSRAAANGEGRPLGVSGTVSDSATYDNRFIIVSDANIAPNWSLVRIGTPSTPLADTMRTRTHELILTVGPGTPPKPEVVKKGKVVAPAQSAIPAIGPFESFNAALIGSAVANAVRPQ